MALGEIKTNIKKKKKEKPKVYPKQVVGKKSG